MTSGFLPRTGVTILHGDDPESTVRLLRRLELSTDLDLEIVIGVPEGHVDVPALADGLRGRGTLASTDPTQAVPVCVNTILANFVDKGVQYAWILSPELLPASPALAILARQMIQMPDCAVVGPRVFQDVAGRPVIWSDGGVVSAEGPVRRLSAGVSKEQAPRAGAVDVEAVPFPGSLYRLSAIAAVGALGGADIVDAHDVGWSDRARQAGWRVMAQRRAQAWLAGADA